MFSMNDTFGGSDCTSELSGSDPDQSDIDYANSDNNMYVEFDC